MNKNDFIKFGFRGWTGALSFEKTTPYLNMSKYIKADSVVRSFLHLTYNVDTKELVIYNIDLHNDEPFFKGKCENNEEFKQILKGIGYE